jgi:hypothetical protein
MKKNCHHNPVLEVEDHYLRGDPRSLGEVSELYIYILEMGRNRPVRHPGQLAKTVAFYLLTM